MPRVYISKSNRRYKKYDKDSIEAALAEYNNNITSLSKVSQKYDIPISVLQRHNTYVMKEPGGQMALTSAVEDFIILILNKCPEFGYTIESIDLKLFIKDCLDKLGYSVKRFKDNTPGSDYIHNFIKRNSEKFNLDTDYKNKKLKTQVASEVLDRCFEDMELVLGAPVASVITDESTLFDEEGKRLKRQLSAAWKYFTKKDGFIATCKLCNNDYSYKSTVSNLRKHWKKQHAKYMDHFGGSDSELDSSTPKQRKFSTRRYFDLTDEEKVARCKLCYKEVQYDSVADLIKHIVEEHGDFDDGTDAENSNAENKRANKSLVWLYFKPCAETEIATCLICRARMSYHNSVSGLKKHLEMEHPRVNFDSQEESKRILISADGELYEIETEPRKEGDDDHQKDPIEMDTVFLEDYEDTLDMPPRTEKRQSFKRKSRQNLIKNKKIKNEFMSINESSTDDEVVFKNKKNNKEKDRIELFGQYLVSLLKELPKSLSDELQGDMIKQVISAKITYEAQCNSKVTGMARKPVTVTELPVIKDSGVNGDC